MLGYLQAANEPIIANSLPILSHLVYMLLSSPNNDHAMPECVSYSLDILSNVGRSLDMTGKRRRGLKEAWLCSVLEGDEAEQIRARCSRHYSLESTFLYCTASYLIFPRLFAFLRSNDREYILKALDCIGRLCHLQENVDLLNDCPESYPRLIVELLSVSTSCVEPAQVVTGRAEYDNALNFSSRPQALVAPMVELSDVAVRDMAVTALYWLVGLSLQWRRAVAAVPRSVELLRRIAVVVPRTESSARAVQVLIALSMDPANRADFLRCQPAMVASACCDEFIAGTYMQYMQYIYIYIQQKNNVQSHIYYVLMYVCRLDIFLHGYQFLHQHPAERRDHGPAQRVQREELPIKYELKYIGDVVKT